MSESPNLYQPPQAELAMTGTTELGGSIEATLAGQGRLSIGGTMADAWERLAGSKRVILGAFLVVYAVSFAAQLAAQFMLPPPTDTVGVLRLAALQLVPALLFYPVIAGLLLAAVRHICGLPISFASVFQHYDKLLSLIVAAVLQILLITIGFVLLVIPGIYLSIAYLLSFVLIVDRGMGPWEAMETSRKLVTKHWFTVFFTLLIVGVLTAISAVLLLIPLIWTLPWSMLCVGVIYRNLAGLKSA